MEHPNALSRIIAEMKKEILQDMQESKVPFTVTTFAQLHDHVDANEYGGFCDDARRAALKAELKAERPNASEEELGEIEHDVISTAQWRADEWLSSGIALLTYLQAKYSEELKVYPLFQVQEGIKADLNLESNWKSRFECANLKVAKETARSLESHSGSKHVARVIVQLTLKV